MSYLTVWPAGKLQPLVSTLNAPTGTVVANAAIIPAGQNGDISTFATNDTDLIIDVNGYFALPAPGGLSLYNTPPCRVLDTRTPAGAQPFSGTLAVNVLDSPCNLPRPAQTFVMNATVLPQGGLSYLSLWPGGQSLPLASTLNATDGTVTSNMALIPSADGVIDAFASDATYLILDLFGYFAP